MATHRQHLKQETVYFVTFTCYRWLPLFEKSNGYDIVYQWFYHLKKYAKLMGYVIMPNHLHILLYLNSKNKTLNNLVGEGKRFMAYRIIKRLKEQKRYQLLRILQEGVTLRDQKKGQKHRFFRLSFDAKPCNKEENILRVLDYIHANPVSGKWKLANDFVDYKHSSAAFYELEKKNNDLIIHYMDVLEGRV